MAKKIRLTYERDIVNIQQSPRSAEEVETETYKGKTNTMICITTNEKCKQHPLQCNTTCYLTQKSALQSFDIQYPCNEHEVKEIAQWLNNEKYQPEVNLWMEVAKEFHFDKPFHENAVKAITQRLIDKGFKISIQECDSDLENYRLECERLAGLVEYWQKKYYDEKPGFKLPKIDHL